MVGQSISQSLVSQLHFARQGHGSRVLSLLALDDDAVEPKTPKRLVFALGCSNLQLSVDGAISY